jgi:SAM-dependent methyltransferase
MKAEYNYEKYDKNWNRPTSDYFKLLVGYLTKNLISYRYSSILEIGFGSGRVASILDNLDFKGTYLGLDIQPKAINFVNQLDFDNNKFKFLLLDELKTDDLNLEHDLNLVIFCLSLCEMNEEVINKYLDFLKDNHVKQILVINPSSQSQLYPSVIRKTLLSAILTKLGIGKPKWIQTSYIIPKNSVFSAIISGKKDRSAKIISRSLGATIQLFIDKGFTLEKYQDIGFKSTTKNNPELSRFEAVWFR